MPLKIDKISKFYLKLLSSVKEKSGDLAIFFWPSQNFSLGRLLFFPSCDGKKVIFSSISPT